VGVGGGHSQGGEIDRVLGEFEHECEG
jgi:hypothetical protein